MKFFKSLLPLVAATTFLSQAHAATVVYGAQHFAKDGSNTSILNNSGDVLAAVNFGPAVARTGPFTNANPNPATTINGIVFTAVSGAAAITNSSLGGSITYSLNTAGIDSNRQSAVDYTAAASLYSLVYDVARTGGNGTPMVLSFSGLNIGTAYSVQMVFSADNLNGNVNDRSLYVTTSPPAGTGTPPASGYDLNYGPTSGPGLLTATFTADSATQTFTLSNINEGNQRVSLAGFVLASNQVIPEPGSCALVALASVIGIGRRRR